LIVAMAENAVSEVFSKTSQPGMQALSTPGSLSFSQTVCCDAGSWYSPVIVIAMAHHSLLRL